MSSILHDKQADTSPAEHADAEQLARREAIRQIERKRRFWVSTIAWTLGVLVLAAIWAISEYHNAGGWPSRGFSQSSGIHDVWNIWIIYPAIAWVFLTSVHAWSVFLHKPISVSEITREIERQARWSPNDAGVSRDRPARGLAGHSHRKPKDSPVVSGTKGLRS